MNSAHSNERNLAHCAATAAMSHPKQTANNELTKLKEEHERQVQTLKLEHKIELLEMNNKMSKEENDNKTKILELQKEVQSLKHENELMKLKSVHEFQSNKMVVDSNSEKQMTAKEIEFKDRLNEKDKEIALKDNEMTLKDNEMTLKIAEKEKEMALKIAEKANEMTLKIAEKDNEMALKIAEKDNEMALKMSEKDKESALKMAEKDGTLLKKENEHKIETVKMKNEMETTIESLRNEVQMLKEEIADPLKLPLMERLEWGLNHYISTTNNLQAIPLLKTSYQEWYENLASAMENEKLYNNERFLFMRKAFGTCHSQVYFENYFIDKTCESSTNGFVVKGLDTELFRKGEFVLLHPKNSLKSSRTKVTSTHNNGKKRYWPLMDVPGELFFGLNKIAIVCWMLKDN